MSEPPAPAINLLLFEVAGIPFALFAEEVEEFAAFDGGSDPELVWFHREFGFRETEVVYRAPVVVTVRTGGGPRFRLIIDRMQEIAPFDWRELRPLPALVEPFALEKGIWGVLPRGGRLVRLIDVRRLLRGKGAPALPGAD